MTESSCASAASGRFRWAPSTPHLLLAVDPRACRQLPASITEAAVAGYCRMTSLHGLVLQWNLLGGGTTDLLLRRLLLSLRCEGFEGLHVSTPNRRDHMFTSGPSFHCFLPFFFLVHCKLAAVVCGWGLCTALLTSLSALKN